MLHKFNSRIRDFLKLNIIPPCQGILQDKVACIPHYIWHNICIKKIYSQMLQHCCFNSSSIIPERQISSCCICYHPVTNFKVYVQSFQLLRHQYFCQYKWFLYYFQITWLCYTIIMALLFTCKHSDDWECQFVVKVSNFWPTTSDRFASEHTQAENMTVLNAAGISHVIITAVVHGSGKKFNFYCLVL